MSRAMVPAGPEQQRLQLISQAFDNRKEIITDQPVRTKAEATQKASCDRAR